MIVNWVRRNQKDVEFTIGILALVCLLFYNWRHTNLLFMTYADWKWLGWLCAFGIELSIIGLSFKVGRQIADGTRFFSSPSQVFFLFVMVMALLVSAIANMVEGYKIAHGEVLTWSILYKIDAVEWVAWVASNGLISLVAFALAEVIGSQSESVMVREVVETTTPELPKPTSKPPSLMDTLEVVVGNTKVNTSDTKAKRNEPTVKERVYRFLEEHKEGVQKTDVVHEIGNKVMVYRSLKELEEAGKIYRPYNDGIVKVVE
jgi:hypothetical protein